MAVQLGLRSRTIGYDPSDRLAIETENFLETSDTGRSLLYWFGDALGAISSIDELEAQLAWDIDALDNLLNRALKAVSHHPRLRRLEALWRSVAWLTNANRDVIVKLLDVTWKQIEEDMEESGDFQSSRIFHKIYTEEFDQNRGKPFGLIVVDTEIRHRISKEHPTDDIAILKHLAEIGASAFAPIVCGVHPSLFQVADFRDLDLKQDIEEMFQQREYMRFRELRDWPDARFLGLVMPRMLIRGPRTERDLIDLGFRFAKMKSGISVGERRFRLCSCCHPRL